jgi:hypothetical protein
VDRSSARRPSRDGASPLDGPVSQVRGSLNERGQVIPNDGHTRARQPLGASMFGERIIRVSVCGTAGQQPSYAPGL